MSVVELKGVSRRYGSAVALNKLDLVVEKGEFLTLLGPSGSGKTTLLNIMAGMTSPSSGRVMIDGRDVTDLPARSRGLGMVFQNYALMPHMTVYENVAFPLRVRKVANQEIRRRVDDVLSIVNLSGLGERKPKELSGGQQQRVSIARCLVYKPSLILMDEPLGALDKKLREQLQLEIKRIHSELGVTIVYVTHDQEEALTLSDRISLMNNGRVEQLGTPHELYFEPRTVFAAQFLGESNSIGATVIDHEVGHTIFETTIGPIRTPRQALDVGAEATLIVRPENIRRLKTNESATNELQVDLVAQTFVGDATRYYFRARSGTTLIVKELTDRVSQSLDGHSARLGWSPEQTLVIPGNAGPHRAADPAGAPTAEAY